MILLHNIIEIFALANLDPLAFITVELFDAGIVGAALVNVDQTGFAVRPDRFVQES